ncbi:hypothetical protein ACFLSQ_05395 [Bacteroidota bacterium]
MKKLVLTLFIFGFFLGCTDDDNIKPNNSNCDQEIIADDSLFANAPDDDFEFVNAEIKGNCLEITISYGGGCGEIELKLIDSEKIIETYPPQRDIRLSFKDEDYCKALIHKNISFDLTLIRIIQTDRVLLNLTGWNDKLLYQY